MDSRPSHVGSFAPDVSGRDVGHDLHDAGVRAGTAWPTLHRHDAVWALEDHHVHRRLALRCPDRPDGGGWTDERRAVSGLDRNLPVPYLAAGDVVIADNLSSHKVAGIQEAIEAVGATLRYLPPYSPGLNPIEKDFAKLKALLRRAGVRAVDAPWNQIGMLLDAFSAEECRNYLKSSGHVNI